ncbi:hypothetical protein [Kaistia sp. MMO-174]|uniref:hypothetical protein n=1 Tax=Kaistia sp. MMO-174 TaxID=3081256 RepID=UPI00301B2A94
MSRPVDLQRKAAQLFNRIATVEDECRVNARMARFAALVLGVGTTAQIADFVASASWLSFGLGAVCFTGMLLDVRLGIAADRDLEALAALRLSLINDEDLRSDARFGLINEGELQ